MSIVKRDENLQRGPPGTYLHNATIASKHNNPDEHRRTRKQRREAKLVNGTQSSVGGSGPWRVIQLSRSSGPWISPVGSRSAEGGQRFLSGGWTLLIVTNKGHLDFASSTLDTLFIIFICTFVCTYLKKAFSWVTRVILTWTCSLPEKNFQHRCPLDFLLT